MAHSKLIELLASYKQMLYVACNYGVYDKAT